MELIFLGTGTSAGVPMIGCDCEVCRSNDPRDCRTRPSVLVRYDGRSYLIDAAPELRQQAIAHDITRLDGVLFTHAHADHVLGIDDLRRFNAVMKGPLDIHAEQSVLDRLGVMFRYIFEAHKNINDSFVANLIAHPRMVGEPFDLSGGTWTPLRLMHGRLPIFGYRIDHGPTGTSGGGGAIAYCTDASSVPPETFPLLENLDVLVIDALRYRHHPTHMTVDQALAVIEQVKPRRAYLTHIAHDIRHADLEPKLPEHVYLSFDGLVVGCGE
ncbi:MAG: MBL fold metallo-hydrolase [Phycisphaeraceae bacterium]|nr:MBL fold metallo-hydrolase [Phycisphaeraceae bacterium]